MLLSSILILSYITQLTLCGRSVTQGYTKCVSPQQLYLRATLLKYGRCVVMFHIFNDLEAIINRSF